MTQQGLNTDAEERDRQIRARDLASRHIFETPVDPSTIGIEPLAGVTNRNYPVTVDGLDGDWAAFTPAERAAFALARNLAATPVVLTDDEVDDAVKQMGPRNTTQLISYTTHRASFNRVTEAAGLRIE